MDHGSEFLLENLQDILKIYQHRSFAWWISPLVDYSELQKALNDIGFKKEADETIMLLDLKHITNISVKHRLEIKKVVTLSQLKDFIQVMKIYDEHVQDIYLNLWNHLQIKDTPLSLYVGYVHDSPVSIGSLFSHEKEGLLTNLITLPEYRGMGFATQMMKYRIQEAARNGCQQVFLTASNDVSKYISEKLGFVSLGEKYDCYECTGALEK